MDPLPLPPLLGLRHVALNVRNVRRSLEFYSSILGMKLEWMPDEQNAYLTSGRDNLALHQLPEGSILGHTFVPVDEVVTASERHTQHLWISTPQASIGYD